MAIPDRSHDVLAARCWLGPLMTAFATIAALVAAAPAQNSNLAMQKADGRWPADDAGGPAPGDLRTSALWQLALVADGSTARSGPNREAIRSTMRWLVQQIDARGRIGLRADAAWPLDHAIATYALVETLRDAPILAADVRRAAAVLTATIEHSRPAVDAEMLLWAEWIAASLRQRESLYVLQSWLADPHRSPRRYRNPRFDPDPMLGARELERAIAAVTPSSPRSPTEIAAAFARRVLRDPSAVVAVAGWPADPLHDPLAAFYCAAGAWQHGTKTWLAMSASLKGIVDRQLMSGRHASTWDPVVPDGEPFAFGRVYGRGGTTAAAILLSTLYYRYCKLSLAQ